MGKIIDRVRRRDDRAAVHRAELFAQEHGKEVIRKTAVALGMKDDPFTGEPFDNRTMWRKVRDMVAERSAEVERLIVRGVRLAEGRKP